MENVIFKCYSEGDISNDDMLFVNASNIQKIRPLQSSEFQKLMIEYCDDDFCVNSTFICDYIEPMDII